MITQCLTSSFKAELLAGLHDFSASSGDTFKIALYGNAADISSATTNYTAVNESSGSGYTAGGATLTNLGITLSGTTAYTSWNDVSWANASFTTAGALIYNASKNNRSVAVLNFGGAYTADGSGPFTVTFPANTSTTAPVIIY
jgi:hypothetical protein